MLKGGYVCVCVCIYIYISIYIYIQSFIFFWFGTIKEREGILTFPYTCETSLITYKDVVNLVE
jgi:hypothetical protein